MFEMTENLIELVEPIRPSPDASTKILVKKFDKDVVFIEASIGAQKKSPSSGAKAELFLVPDDTLTFDDDGNITSEPGKVYRINEITITVLHKWEFFDTEKLLLGRVIPAGNCLVVKAQYVTLGFAVYGYVH